MGGEEAEAEGVDHSFEKFGRESQEGERGRELEGVAESSKGFWPGKGKASGKAEGPVGIRAPLAS